MGKINYMGFLGFLGFMGLSDPWFFLFFLFFLFFFSPAQKKADVPRPVREMMEKKEEGKVKILKELTLRQAQGKPRITNDEVQKLLGVSDASAERYLQELEQEGKIKQVGGAERDTYYTKI